MAKNEEEITPKQKTEQIEQGKNWIVEFWRVRGYETVKTALGINFTLHRPPKYEHLGLDLQYLEQFEAEVKEQTSKEVEEECQAKLPSIIKQANKFHREEIFKDIETLMVIVGDKAGHDTKFKHTAWFQELSYKLYKLRQKKEEGLNENQ